MLEICQLDYLVSYRIASFLSFKDFNTLIRTFIKKKEAPEAIVDISCAAKDTVLSHALESQLSFVSSTRRRELPIDRLTSDGRIGAPGRP